MNGIDLVVGTVTVASPLEVSIGGGPSARTARVNTGWTPTVGARVIVAVDAKTRARLFALGGLVL